MSVKINNLCFSYDKNNYVLKDLSIEISNGEIIGIVGKTGCGKSTLIQIIAGLLNPSSGSVIIDDEDIFDKKYNRCNLRKKFGIVFQYPEMQLFEQSVEKDIAFGLKNSGLGKAEKSELVRWAAELMKLDFDKIKNKSPLALSGGEKRKVAIAGVIAIKPEYLILDEPVAGLDPLSRDDFMNTLMQLKNHGTTIIMVSHNADILAEYADRIAVMDNGKIVKIGTPNEIYSDFDKMKNLNLGVCNVKEIAHMLSEKDISISDNTIKYNDLLNEFVAKFSD